MSHVVEASPLGQTDRAPAPDLVLIPDTDGPHVRLGVAWFVVVVGAAASGPGWLALVMAALGGLVGDRLAARWRLGGWPAADRVLIAGGALMPMAALAGTRGVVIGLWLIPIVGLAAALERREPDVDRLVATAMAIGTAVLIGLAAAAPVVAAAQIGTGAAIALLVVMAAYDAGHYLIGSGAAGAWEGPVGGALAVGVVSFSLAVFNAAGVGMTNTAIASTVFALAAPAGVLIGAVLLVGRAPGVAPSSEAGAGDVGEPAEGALSGLVGVVGGVTGAVRRLDSLLVAGPLYVATLLAVA